MEAECFGGCGVVAAAFGDVQVAGVFDGSDDGGADGGQVDRPAAGTGGGGVLAEGHVRDVTYDEDRSQVRTANGPRVMASLRNLAITILRLTGETSIATALAGHCKRS